MPNSTTSNFRDWKTKILATENGNVSEENYLQFSCERCYCSLFENYSKSFISGIAVASEIRQCSTERKPGVFTFF